MYLATTVAHHDQLDLEKSYVKPNDEYPSARRVDISLSVFRGQSSYAASIAHLHITADEAHWLMENLAAALLAPPPERPADA